MLFCLGLGWSSDAVGVDEQLGKLANIVPPTDERYVFLGNYPPSLA